MAGCSLRTRLDKSNFMTSLSRAPPQRWQAEANLFLHEALKQTRITTFAAITALAQEL